MPNHVTNLLTISGSEELVAKIRSEISSTHDDGSPRPIDFNKIANLPKELKNTTSPSRIISQEEYDTQEARIAAGDLTDAEKSFGISRGITKEMSKEFIEKYGTDNWYNWQVNAWGTKWNAYEQDDKENGVIKFQTAWSTPVNIIRLLSLKYPEAEFNVRFADEDFGHNVGEYTFKNGEEVYEDVPEGGSIEAYMMAADVQNDWDYIVARIEEIDEEEFKEKWAKMYVRVAYERALFGDYQKFVWDYLQAIAVEEENYELAQKIKEYLEQRINA